jgi:anti-sigma regulatory factor (Ser/Thr protein kinase)
VRIFPPAENPPPGETLLELEVPSAPGNERLAIAGVADAVASLDLPSAQLERLKTAVGEATMNAIEHGNGSDPAKSVRVAVHAEGRRLTIDVQDRGGDRPLPDPDAIEVPDLEAKLAGLQTPRGWGLFLIRNMVDAMELRNVPGGHLLELRLDLAEDPAGSNPDGGLHDAR